MLWSQHLHTSNEYSVCLSVSLSLCLSLSLSLSASPTASCKSQLSLRSTSDTGHARTLQRPITSGDSHTQTQWNQTTDLRKRKHQVSLSLSVCLFKWFSLIFFCLFLSFCCCLPVFAIPVCLTLFLLFFFPPCLYQFLPLSFPTFLGSLPLSACLTFFHPLYFPFVFVSLSFPLCLSHSSFPCLFSSLLVSIFFSNSLTLIFLSRPVSLSFALSIVLSCLSLFRFLHVSLNFFLPLFSYRLTLISPPCLSFFHPLDFLSCPSHSGFPSLSPLFLSSCLTLIFLFCLSYSLLPSLLSFPVCLAFVTPCQSQFLSPTLFLPYRLTLISPTCLSYFCSPS